MDAFYFLAMLIGVAWLCIWSILPEGSRFSRWWWPFDILERPAQDADPSPHPAEPTSGPRGRSPQHLRRAGGGGSEGGWRAAAAAASAGTAPRGRQQ